MPGVAASGLFLARQCVFAAPAQVATGHRPLENFRDHVPSSDPFLYLHRLWCDAVSIYQENGSTYVGVRSHPTQRNVAFAARARGREPAFVCVPQWRPDASECGSSADPRPSAGWVVLFVPSNGDSAGPSIHPITNIPDRAPSKSDSKQSTRRFCHSEYFMAGGPLAPG